jgi:GT2 family glycosyltransferase
VTGLARVAVNIVTHNSAESVETCLQSVFDQDFEDVEVTVIDNVSRDGTVNRLAPWRERGVRLMANATNLYYARAHNLGIEETASEIVLTLNPDVILRSDFLRKAVQALERSPRIGAVNGKLLLPPEGRLNLGMLRQPPSAETLIDSAGLMMYRSRRPYLRGNRKPHGDCCLEGAYIFGVDGACALYRRSMLEDVAIEGEVFDSDFVMYREDVDLAWRAQLLGWDSYYAPEALGYHVRGFHLGRGRKEIPTLLKRHSVKNGWLLLLKNDTLGSLARDWRYIAPYQLKIAAGLLAVERSSLAALPDTLGLLPRIMRKRAEIQGRRRRPEEEMRKWFE